MAERAIAPRTYLFVWILLMLLTVLTVSISFAHLSGAWHVVLGLVIAICKSSLVVLFFMHALASPRVTWIVIVVSAFWLCIMITLTFVDYLGRDLIPYTPGR